MSGPERSWDGPDLGVLCWGVMQRHHGGFKQDRRVLRPGMLALCPGDLPLSVTPSLWDAPSPIPLNPFLRSNDKSRC